jgi:uncharacterized membrane protein YjjP (DUF1212 family)
VRAVILAQGISLLESIPWKTIAVPSIILGFAVTVFDIFTRRKHDRAEMELLKDHRDLLIRIDDHTSQISDAAHDINEITLSNAGYHPYTVKTDKESELPRIGGE